ncbi:MAG: ribosome small subunit-dependent GTPase A [Bacillota bacterium]|jgi:ribosome biogenesis GTPase
MYPNGNEQLYGIVLWGYGGFYHVLLPNDYLLCKLRGIVKNSALGIYPGDKVRVSRLVKSEKPHQEKISKEGMIEEVMPRKNQLQRPKVANVEQAILLLAAKDPKPDFLLLDRMLVMSAYNDVKPVICINKCDLLSGSEQELLIKELQPYRQARFPILLLSAKTGQNIDQLVDVLAGRFSVFAGPSGIGKSSLLNAINPELALPVGKISHRLQRGRHTTRHVKIMLLPRDSLVADTPGFSLLDLPQELRIRDVKNYYPDFMELGPCRFDGCIHDQEPDCAIKEAHQKGIVSDGRYKRYLRLLSELREREERY